MIRNTNRLILKRCFDIFITIFLIIALLPVFMILACLIRYKLGKPIIFVQDRIGLDGKKFALVKFRSMTDERDMNGNLLPDSQRITSFGKFLRSSSLDELPELWNILKNEMSLVGPRPLLIKYLNRYSPTQARRHEVKPGLTGWAQVNGRNTLSWEKKFNLDVWYVDHHSLGLDILILWMTVGRVLQRDGINASNEVTMPEFLGESKE
jgi:sugar transferase EpsL